MVATLKCKYTPCLKKTVPTYFLLLSVKYEPISIKIGRIVPEETLNETVGSRALSFSGPLLSVDVDVCGSVCLSVRNFEVKYLGNQRR